MYLETASDKALRVAMSEKNVLFLCFQKMIWCYNRFNELLKM